MEPDDFYLDFLSPTSSSSSAYTPPFFFVPTSSSSSTYSPPFFFAGAAELGWSLSLGILFAAVAPVAPRAPKNLTKAIELTHGALRGAKALRHVPSPSSPESLLFASKAFAQGYKITKNLNLQRPKPISLLYKRLKPCFGAINIVKYVRSPISDGGFLGFGIFSYGYKFSKNVVRVLEGLVGLELDAAVRNGFDAVGLMMKTVKVAKEVATMVLRVGEDEEGGGDFWFLGCDEIDGRCGVCAERKDLGEVGAGGGVWERKVEAEFLLEGEEKTMAMLEELLCLSVPLDERLIRGESKP